MSAAVASGVPWHHVIIVCGVFVAVGVIALLVGRVRPRRKTLIRQLQT